MITRVRQVSFPPTFAGWQGAARRALAENCPPAEIFWQELGDSQPSLDLVGEMEGLAAPNPRVFSVPAEFLKIAVRVSCHRHSERWSLLYRILWRLTRGEPHLPQVPIDPDIHQLNALDKAVRHDVHKMRAFVRFREVKQGDDPCYVAWFEPEHYIVELNAKFFTDRFASMKWSILTPDRCAHWDGKNLSFSDGVSRSESPQGDDMEQLWKRYYSSIFNPARVKQSAMLSEMPKRYWKNLPEAAIIPKLLREAGGRSNAMLAKSRDEAEVPIVSGKIEIPAQATLQNLREAAAHCQACPLFRHASQTVFGEGNPQARLVLVGEQPGNQEDKQGHPFVGPAGQLLDRALAEAGIDRDQLYLTNAVKHFKWEPRGKIRLHKKASAQEASICRTWLEEEMKLLQPEVVLCLGATAATSVLGPGIRVMQDRGRWMTSSFAAKTLVTFHPSALLRMTDEKIRTENYRVFVEDLRMAAADLAK